MTDWDEVRAFLDEKGMAAVEEVVADGVPRELAGQRVAHFNDMLIEKLRAAE